jgi:hypothetical protein
VPTSSVRCLLQTDGDTGIKTVVLEPSSAFLFRVLTAYINIYMLVNIYAVVVFVYLTSCWRVYCCPDEAGHTSRVTLLGIFAKKPVIGEQTQLVHDNLLRLFIDVVPPSPNISGKLHARLVGAEWIIVCLPVCRQTNVYALYSKIPTCKKRTLLLDVASCVEMYLLFNLPVACLLDDSGCASARVLIGVA